MLSMFLQHHISKASILFLSDFFKVHPSTPYWNTAHTIDFMTLTFVTVFIFRSFQILASTTAFCLAIAMRFLISLVQSPSADLYDPRNFKLSTVKIRLGVWSVGELTESVTDTQTHTHTMTLTYIISEIKRDTGRKSHFFHIPLLYSNSLREKVAIIFCAFFTTEPDPCPSRWCKSSLMKWNNRVCVVMRTAVSTMWHK